MPEIEIKSIRALTGANVWAYCPVLDALTAIGKYEQLPSNRLPGFTERLVELVPTLYEHRCSEGRRGGFLERLRRGTYMGHIIEHIALELQSLAGMEMTFGKTRGADNPGEYHVVIGYKDIEAGKMCLRLAAEIAETLAENRPPAFVLKERIEEIREVGVDNMLGPSTQSIVDAARRRGIPWFRLDEGSLVQLGHGKYAKRISASETSLTSSIAVELASDKEMTKRLLSKVGVPVPEGEVVDNADDAWMAAVALDSPVVVKPFDGNQGKAVSVDLATEEQVRKAFELAQHYSNRVLVERFVQGNDYRLLVVNGKMVAASLRRPAQVVADGLSTVCDLVRRVNEDPRRGAGHGAALTRITMDAAAELTLGKQGYTWESVPPPGQVVFLRDNSNLSTGGSATDVTREVHPDNAAVAVLAAQAIGLDVAGVDVVCQDIADPLAEQGGAVVEVNAAPGLRMHVFPSEGRSRNVGKAIVDMLFPGDTTARVPLIAITGTNGKTTVTRMIAHVYSTMGSFAGMTTTDGIYFNGVRRITGDCSGPRSAEAVLQHPQVEVAVLETARGGILRSGLAWDRSTVSVVLNIAADHLGLGGVHTLQQLARVKRVIVESVDDDGYAVLNAEDQLVADMARHCPGSVMFFSTDAQSPVVTRHLAHGGKAVYLHEDAIIMADGAQETVLSHVADIPATHGGMIPFQVHNAMAATAACWAAGVPLDSIRLGLRTFQADDRTAPGRFNMFDIGGATVIVDYGHNPHALRAVQAAITRMEPRRSIGVIAAPGDRRDEDIRELATIAADTFDWVIVREDTDLRGREPGEVARILSETVEEVCPSLPVSIIAEEDEAVRQALDMARAGDLVMLFVDHVEEALDYVKHVGETARVAPADAFWNADVLPPVSSMPAVHTSPPQAGQANGRGKGRTGRVKAGSPRMQQDPPTNSPVPGEGDYLG